MFRILIRLLIRLNINMIVFASRSAYCAILLVNAVHHIRELYTLIFTQKTTTKKLMRIFIKIDRKSLIQNQYVVYFIVSSLHYCLPMAFRAHQTLNCFPDCKTNFPFARTVHVTLEWMLQDNSDCMMKFSFDFNFSVENIIFIRIFPQISAKGPIAAEI